MVKPSLRRSGAGAPIATCRASDRASGQRLRAARRANGWVIGAAVMHVFRDLRLIPIVAIAAAALFRAPRLPPIVIEGGYTLIASRSAQAQGLELMRVAPMRVEPMPLELAPLEPVPLEPAQRMRLRGSQAARHLRRPPTAAAAETGRSARRPGAQRHFALLGARSLRSLPASGDNHRIGRRAQARGRAGGA